MKWLIGIKQKTKIAWLFALVFLLVLMKNMLDKKNVADLGDTFSAVYEDRFMAESYIFKISDQLYQKKILLEKDFKNSNNLNEEKVFNSERLITELISDFDKTKLTSAESVVLDNFKLKIDELHRLEHEVNDALKVGVQDVNLKTRLDEHFWNTLQDLNNLSEIQISEGKYLNESSRKIIAGNIILTNFEFMLLILIGILIQALVFASKAIIPKSVQRHRMN